MAFPIDRVNERSYPEEWSGNVVTCDIDRTYLATRVSSLSGMLAIPFQFAVDKRDIAGMARLLKELRRGNDQRVSRHTPIYFLSASPAQLRPVIQRKMLMDGLEYDGTTFKDWKRVLLSGRLKRFREQVGFKITALLTKRTELPGGSRELLIGDDIESDALSFSLYADIIAGRIPLDDVPAALQQWGVAADDAAHIKGLRARLGDEHEGVQRILIRCERGTPEDLLGYAPHVIAGRSAFQLALGALACDAVSIRGVRLVAKEQADRGSAAEQLSGDLDDAVQRGVLPAELARRVGSDLAEHRLVGPKVALVDRPAGMWQEAIEVAAARPERPWAAAARR